LSGAGFTLALQYIAAQHKGYRFSFQDDRMSLHTANTSLQGLKGLVVGIANQHSIAWGCAEAFRSAGADLAITYLNAKAEPHVRPLAESVQAALIEPLDVEEDAQMANLFDKINREWGQLDFVLHSIAFAPLDDLHGPVLNSSKAGFARAMDISCHSLIRLARHAAPLMKTGGSLLTMSYEGANRVAPKYGIMGLAKAALESATRALAAELGPLNISVNAISPGPIATRAASGIQDFDQLMQDSIDRAPLRRVVTIDEVGALASLLASPAGRGITGDVIVIDGGRHILY
jgi:enoyl-[acyl-carrier protein] reductase I